MNNVKTTISAMVFSLAASFPVLAFAAQPVIDVDSLNELKQIRAILEQNVQKNFTCTDGEKSYTAGMDVNRNGNQYKCEVKGDHTGGFSFRAWVSQKIIQRPRRLLFPAFSRKFFRPIPLRKSQNSRSAPPLLPPSKNSPIIFAPQTI